MQENRKSMRCNHFYDTIEILRELKEKRASRQLWSAAGLRLCTSTHMSDEIF